MKSEAIYLEAALGLFRDGDYEGAGAVCEAGLWEHGDSGRLWEILGTVLWLKGEMSSAMAALETAGVHVPLTARAQFALAAAYAHAGKHDLARTIYRHLKDHPDFPVPLLPQLAAALGRVGEDEAALLICEQIVSARPEHHQAWFGIAYYRRRIGRGVWETIPPLRTAHELAPEMRTYRLNLAACYAEAGRADLAYRHAREVPVAEVRCPHWLRTLAPVFEAAGDHERAAECRKLLADLGEEPSPESWNPDGGCPGCG